MLYLHVFGRGYNKVVVRWSQSGGAHTWLPVFRTNLEHVSAPFVTSQRDDFKKCINPLRSEASIRREGRGSLSTGRIHIWDDDVDFALI